MHYSYRFSWGKTIAVCAPFAFAPAVFAAPAGGAVVAGSAVVAVSGGNTVVTQSSQHAALNWQQFNIAPGESVRFVQPNASSVALNRVIGSDPSTILGNLSANGKVFLVNPNGILFGHGAQVNVNGLVASTLEITDTDFMAGRYRFGLTGANGVAGAKVVNQGAITVNTDGGYVALLGANVSNQGVIAARLGSVALVAGDAITLDVAGDGLLNISVDKGALQALVDNGGVINTDGGQVLLTSRSASALLGSAVNNTGVIQAQTIENRNGTIRLLGDMQSGTVHVGGKLIADAPSGGDGGFIDTSAATVRIKPDVHIDTTASFGKTGTWLIDPHDFNINASSGDLTGLALSTALGTTSVSIMSSQGATASGAGNINVNDAVTWSSNNRLTLTASNHINVNANITATGTGAGITLNPNTANGGEAASGTGTVNFAMNNSISLPNVSPASNTALVINGNSYTVINSLGVQGSSTGTDLQGINGNLARRYALGSNIDAASTSGWNAGAGFMPLGNATTPFTGIFNGLGHAISNLTINRPATDNVGLFGVTAGAIISNIGVTNVSVAGREGFGALAGRADAGTAITNSYSSGNATASIYSDVGGLVGQLWNGSTISGSHSAVTVNTGGGNAGGLVGQLVSSSRIIDSYATGNVTGQNYTVGGLVGYANGSGNIITNSYATGNVSTTQGNAGGLVGANEGTITGSYATGTVNGAGSVGGLVGSNNSSATSYVANSYATGAVTGTYNTGGLTGFQGGAISNSYATGNVRGTHNVGGLSGYLVGTITASHATGSVTNSGGNTGGLVGGGQGSIDRSYATGAISSNDYNAGGLVGVIGGTGISNSYANGSISGVNNVGGLVGYNDSALINASHATGNVTATSFNIGGLVGSNAGITTNSYATGAVSGAGNVGGFAGTNTSTISDSYASGAVIGAYNTGGLIGYNPGIATNVHSSGNVSGGGIDFGGLIGLHSGTVASSFATGNVTNNANSGVYTGGLIGRLEGNGKISTSYATGNVTASGQDAGGLVGRMDSAGNSIENSYATGPVNGNDYNVGGLLGLMLNGTVSNSYSTGAVTGVGNVGGLIGAKGSGTVTGSYWNVTASGLATSAGGAGAVGKTTAQMLSQSTYSGWDFGAIWTMYEGYTNPLLRSFLKPLTVTANDATKIYDRTGFSGGNSVSYSVASPANVFGTRVYAGAAQGAVNVGNYTLTASGLFSNQQGFLISYAPGTLTVTPKALIITGLSAANKIYDGSTAAATSGGMLSGIIAGDTAGLTSIGTFATKNVGTGINVTLNNRLTGASAVNYSVGTTTTFADIAPKSLTVTGTTAANKIYDGTTTAALTGGILAGVISGDLVTLGQAGNFVSKDAGAAVSITANDSLGGSDAGNYTMTQPTGLVGDIAPRQLLVNATGINKIYDGTAVGAATLTDNRLANDNFILTNSSMTFDDKNVGASKPMIISGIRAIGVDAGNYFLNTSAMAAANITPAPLRITANNAARLPATPNPLFTARYAGLVADESPLVLDGSLGFTTPATIGSATGAYSVKPSGLTSTNYAIQYVDGALVVLPSERLFTAFGFVQQAEFAMPAVQKPAVKHFADWKSGDSPTLDFTLDRPPVKVPADVLVPD